jgi:TATA-binding protein-associated factor
MSKKSSEEEGNAVVTGLGGSGKGMKEMLSTLEELWDQSQYTEEYDLRQFVARLS